MKEIIVIVGFMVCCAGCATYATKVSRHPVEGITAPARVEPEYVDIYLDCGQSRLGAFHIEIHYDPAVVAISEIESAPEGAFSCSPIAKRETFSSGQTGIIGLIPGGRGPGGRVAIARVHFKGVSRGKSGVSVSIKSLYDSESSRITGVAILSSGELTVTQE